MSLADSLCASARCAERWQGGVGICVERGFKGEGGVCVCVCAEGWVSRCVGHTYLHDHEASSVLGGQWPLSASAGPPLLA